MNKYSSYYDVYGVTLKVITYNYNIHKFIDNNYSLFKNNSIKKNINITVDLNKKEIQKKIKQKKSLNYLGNSIHYGKNILHWSNEYGLTTHLEIKSETKWKIYCYHFDLDKKLTRRKINENYSRIMRYAIHLPLFKFIEIKKGLYLLHGSAISHGSKSNLFIGLNKVGKSTLSKFLISKTSSKYISDNFILTNGDKIFPFFENLRLDNDSIKYLKIKKNKKNIFLYNKFHIDITNDFIIDTKKIHNIFILNNSSKFSIKKINRQRALILINNINYLLKEFPEFHFTSLIDFILNKKKRNLFNLQNNIKFYIMSIPKNFSLQNNLNKILKYL